MTGQSRRNLSERMQRATARPIRSSPEAASPAPVAPRAKPIRVTLDLAPATYRELQAFCAAAAIELERPRVASAEVLRVLLAQLSKNTELADQVRGELSV